MGKLARTFTAGTAFIAATLAFGVGGASGWEYVTGPPKVEVASWSLPWGAEFAPQQRRFEISINSGYCSGEPPPVFDHVELVERPKTARRPRGAAVITAYIRFPEPTEVKGEVKEGEPGPGCAGLGYFVTGHVKLKRPVARVPLFDGRTTPPRRVHLRP